MTEAWNSLKWDFEEIEPSSSMKSEVMNFVFETDDEVPVTKEKKWSGFFLKQFTPVTSGILLATLVLSFVLLYSNIQLKKNLQPSICQWRLKRHYLCSLLIRQL